jgi:hypothetical protein
VKGLGGCHHRRKFYNQTDKHMWELPRSQQTTVDISSLHMF